MYLFHSCLTGGWLFYAITSKSVWLDTIKLNRWHCLLLAWYRLVIIYQKTIINHSTLILIICRPTFKRIVRNKSTEQFSGLPYLYSLLNCLICMWYGLPFISYGVLLVVTVNSIGAAFQLTYLILFIVYADPKRKVTALLKFSVKHPIFLLIYHEYLSVGADKDGRFVDWGFVLICINSLC